MRTTVVDVTAKLMVTNGVVQVNEVGTPSQSIHAWLRRHMEEHPANRYELVVGTNVVVELGAGDANRPDLTQTIIVQFDKERMNFGEEVRVRLITTAPVAQVAQEPAPAREPAKYEKLQTGEVPERAMWEVTRMPKAALESIVEQSLALDRWKVVIAFCELQRRSRAVDPRMVNSFLMLAKVQGFADSDALCDDTLRKLGHKDYITLLKRLNELDIPVVKASQGSMPQDAPKQGAGVTSAQAVSDKGGAWYKKWYAITAASVLVLAMLTNPGVEKHREAVMNEFQGSMRNETSNDFERAGKMIGLAFAETIVKQAVSTNNYIIFSTTKLTVDRETKTIGFGCFGQVFISDEAKRKMRS